MDESQNSIFPHQRNLSSASDRTPAVADGPPSGSAGPSKPVTRRRPNSEQINLRRNDLPGGASVVVYCGNEEVVSRGFLIALGAMGVAVFTEAIEPPEPPDAPIKP